MNTQSEGTDFVWKTAIRKGFLEEVIFKLRAEG